MKKIMGLIILIKLAIFPFPVIECIVNGIPSTNGQFPYMVGLMIKDYNLLNCGGAIVSSRLILTTSHCICHNWSHEYYYALVGTADLTYGGYQYELEASICHADFVPEPLSNDIGFVRTTKPIKFNSFVKFIALQRDTIPAGDFIIATGWGSLAKHGGWFPDVLRYDFLEIIDSTVCKSTFGTPFGNKFICSKVSKHKGMCEGDSGSPVIYNGALAGISFASSDGSADLFVEIAGYIPWIMRTILINNRDETGHLFIHRDRLNNYTDYYLGYMHKEYVTAEQPEELITIDH